ncbi:response regulator [Verrucomicrobiota bacterium]
MRVQTKFMLVFAGYMILLTLCGVGLYEYNRGVRRVVTSEVARSVEYIVSQAVDFRCVPYYRFLTQFRKCRYVGRLVAGDTSERGVADIASAIDCYDIDAISFFNSDFERTFRKAREGVAQPDRFPVPASLSGQVFAAQDELHFFMKHAGQLLEVCAVAVRDPASRILGYIAVTRVWDDSLLMRMDLAGTRNVVFRLSESGDVADHSSQGVVAHRDLKDWAGRTVAHLHARYESPLNGLHKLQEQEALLQVVFPGSFAVLLILCLLFWVIWPLRRLESALAAGNAVSLKGLGGRRNEFGKMATLIGRFFEQNKELETARDAAMSASRAKSGFLAAMSHEIRTPMNSLMGMIDLLKRGQVGEEQERLIGIMDRSCESLLTIINEILDFSRIEAGKLNLNPEEFNLYQLAEDLELAAFQLRGDKPVDIDLFIDSELPRWLVGDEVRIRQVFLNLISNAVKFTEEGRVQISIIVKGTGSGFCNVVLMVADTGIGIEPEQYPRIFNSYAQAVTPESIIAGSGLGLAICKKLVELMDGIIEVDSTPNEGSVFSVELKLPVARLGTKELAVAPRSGPLDLAVLIVEDQSMNAQVLEGMLLQIGCRADVAEDGAVALERLQQGSYDVIFMDCHMPVMDGYECTRRIREMEKSTSVHIPILALTADAMAGTRERCLKAGMDDYLTKPIQLDGLREVLGKYAP